MTAITKRIKKRITKDEVTGYMCDRCKKVYSVDDIFELQEFHHISFRGGYASVFGDEFYVECDICQRCLKDLIDSFAKVTE